MCFYRQTGGTFCSVEMLGDVVLQHFFTCLCIAQERYPSSEELDTMQEFFSKYGTVAHIERRIPVHSKARVGNI